MTAESIGTSRVRTLAFVPFFSFLVSAGCATTLSSFQPAHVPAPRHFQAESGIDVSYSPDGLQQIRDASRQIDKSSSQQEQLTDAERNTILRGGAQLGLNPPAIIQHLGLSYSPIESWEVTARFCATGWRLGVRRQFATQDENGIDFTVGFGVGRAAFDPPVGDVFDSIHVDNFSRWNLDLPVTLGQHAPGYRWWAGPRIVYSSMSQDMRLSFSGDEQVRGSISGHGLYLGASVGVALGFRSVFVGPELTLAWLLGSADVRASDGKYVNIAETVSIDAFIVYPGVAVMGEF
jgi:hypothetical protein